MGDRKLSLKSFMSNIRNQRLTEVVASRTRSLTVVLDGVHDPHNFSAVLRSSEAFGVLHVHVVTSSGPFVVNPVITQGAEKWVEVHQYAEPEQCVGVLKNDFKIWIASPSTGSIAVDDVPWEDPIALVFGNEHCGVSPATQEASSGSFCVPMYGFSQSFNISVSVAITLAIAVRKREKRPQGHGDLSPEAQKALLAEYQKRSVRGSSRILERLNKKKASP
jgi:tRNA (guanosine-2'-O-)-methyltransferase